MTETSTVVSNTLPSEWMSGHVGVPTPAAKIKLADAPAFGYLASDRKGEICVKGEVCISGYFRDPEATKSLIDADGWLHTGDLGEILPNGNLRVLERAKNAFKLANGEFVAPERIEGAYGRSPYVLNVYVHGDPTKV